MREERKWEHTRFLAQYLHSQITGKPITAQELVPLSFDKEPDKESGKSGPISKEEVRKMEERLKRELNG